MNAPSRDSALSSAYMEAFKATGVEVLLLYSTVDDYLKFARMLLGDGRLGDVRLLAPETVEAT